MRLKEVSRFLNYHKTAFEFKYDEHKDYIDDIKTMVAEGYLIASNPMFIVTRKYLDFLKKNVDSN